MEAEAEDEEATEAEAAEEELDSKEDGHSNSNRFKVIPCTQFSLSSSCRRPVCYYRRR